MAKKNKFTEQEIKHLEFIQDGINRFGSNSFQMKGWMLAIVSALLGFFASSDNTKFAVVAILPVLVFWGLDAYYLQLERKFRGIYNDVIHSEKDIAPFEMPFQNYKNGKYAFWDVVFSKTLLFLYLPVILILVAVYLFM